jgi:hypothetical protein
MERYIGMDVHAASCTLAVISEKGRKLKDFPVETKRRICEECSHATHCVAAGVSIHERPDPRHTIQRSHR